MSDVSPVSGISGLSFDSSLLSRLLFFRLLPLLFLSCLFFSCLLAHSSFFFFFFFFSRKFLRFFRLEMGFFWSGSCLAARR